MLTTPGQKRAPQRLGTLNAMKAKRAVYIVLFRGVGGATQLPVARLRAGLTAARVVCAVRV